MNVRFNGAWEGASAASRLALEGGVTTIIYESNYFGLEEPVDSPLYTDFGQIARVDEIGDSALAFKCYLTSPGPYAGHMDDLQAALDKAAAANKPLIVDPSVAAPHLLYQVSPYRYNELSVRLEPFQPRAVASDFAIAVDLDINDGLSDSDESPLLPIACSARKSTEDTITRKRSLVQEVERMRLSFEGLSSAVLEQYSYSKARAYTGGNSPVLHTGSRLDKWRPTSIATAKQLVDETSYSTYVLNIPTTWECRGLEQLMACHWSTPVIVANVSSAAAVALLVDAALSGVYVESAPHFFHFSSEEIARTQTEFKNTPPIRSAKNRVVLGKHLARGYINILSSQHNPIEPQFKLPEFCRAVSGIRSLGNTFQAAVHCLKQSCSLVEALVEVLRMMCYTPARILNLQQKKGGIATGKHADFFVWDPRRTSQGSGVFSATEFTGVVDSVFLRGRRVKSGTALFPGGQHVFI